MSELWLSHELDLARSAIAPAVTPEDISVAKLHCLSPSTLKKADVRFSTNIRPFGPCDDSGGLWVHGLGRLRLAQEGEAGAGRLSPVAGLLAA